MALTIEVNTKRLDHFTYSWDWVGQCWGLIFWNDNLSIPFIKVTLPDGTVVNLKMLYLTKEQAEQVGKDIMDKGIATLSENVIEGK